MLLSSSSLIDKTNLQNTVYLLQTLFKAIALGAISNQGFSSDSSSLDVKNDNYASWPFMF